VSDFYDKSFQFYMAICDTVGNEKLKEYYLDVSCRTRLFRIRAHPPDGAMTPEIGELLQKGIHRRLEVVKALRSRDPEAVAAVMRDNVEKSFLNNEKMFFRHQASNSVQSGRVA
jgi:DNA-binding GntR family transcriptional regulator